MSPWFRGLLLLACLATAAPCAAQGTPSGTPSGAAPSPAPDPAPAPAPASGNWFGDRVRVAGEASASMSTLGAREEGWFNFSDYENSTVRSLRLSLVGEVTLTRRIAFITEVRTLQLQRPEAYALYLRVRPWLSEPLDIHVGRIPPTFGSFPRRLYVADNPLVGMPLAFQYLTSNRPDALPATADELARMRARGWLASYSVGSRTEAAGLPVANALRWDTGVQVRWQRDRVTLYGALTQGTLGNPRLSDDNGGPQLAARVAYEPHPVLALGASVASGPYLARSLTASLPGRGRLRRHRQQAYGADAELSRDRWLVRGEAVWNRWEQPAFGVQSVRDLSVIAAMVEARYKLWPGVYAAGRVDHLAFSTVATSLGVLTWDADVRRVELGGGWTVHRHVLVKAAWQRNRRDGGRVRASDLGVVQVVTWF